jgi:chlorite dismutase
LATDYRRINAAVRYEMFSVFQVKPGALGEDRAAAIVEARTYLDGLVDHRTMLATMASKRATTRTCGRTPSQARRHVRTEIPFFAGPRVSVDRLITELP